jgi:HK97 gp10 family phage protein
MADAFRIEFDVTGINAKLDQMAVGMAEKVRPAAQAAAQVFYDEARLRVPVSLKGHWFYGTSFKKTGQKYYFEPESLKAAIYQVFSKDNSDEKKSTYHIAWNHKKVPYGFMVEFGTSRAPAHPFLRPSFDARARDAIEAGKARYAQGFQEVVSGLKS